MTSSDKTLRTHSLEGGGEEKKKQRRRIYNYTFGYVVSTRI